MKQVALCTALFVISVFLGTKVGKNVKDESTNQQDTQTSRQIRAPQFGSGNARPAETKRPNGESIAPIGIAQSKVRRLIERLHTARPDEFVEVWEAILADQAASRKRFDIWFDTNEMRQLVLSEWTAIDPDGAWAHFSQDNGNDKSKSLIAKEWLETDPEAAIKKLTEMPWADTHRWLQAAIAKHDPQLAMEHWAATAPSDEPPPVSILSALANRDPMAAIALLEEHDSQYTESPLPKIASSWPLAQIDQLLPIISAYESDSNSDTGTEKRRKRTRANQRMLEEIGRRLRREMDSHHALESLLSHPSGDVRNRLFDGFLGYGQTLASESLERISQLPENELHELDIYGDLLSMKHSDPNQTWEWLNSLSPELQTKALSSRLNAFAQNWATSDPHLAASKIAELPSAEAQTKFAEGLAKGVASHFPDQSMQLLAQLPDHVREAYTLSIAETMSSGRPDEFIAQLKSVTDPETRTALQRGGFDGIALDNPATAADLVFELFTDPEEIVEHATTVIDLWALRDPTAATQWIDTLPEEMRDQAHTDLGDSVSDQNLLEASTIYLRISDPEKRTEALEEHLGGLFFLDQQAATEHLNELTLDEAERANLLEKLESAQ